MAENGRNCAGFPAQIIGPKLIFCLICNFLQHFFSVDFFFWSCTPQSARGQGAPALATLTPLWVHCWCAGTSSKSFMTSVAARELLICVHRAWAAFTPPSPRSVATPWAVFFGFSIASLFVTRKLFSSSICLPCESWSLSFCSIPKKFLASVLLPNNNVCSCAHLFGCGISDMQLADIHAAHFWRLGVRTGIGDMSECRNPRLTLTRFVWDVGYVRLAV